MVLEHRERRPGDPGETTYVCGVCGLRFETERDLERHVADAGLLY